MATNDAVNVGLAGSTGTGTFVGATSPTLVTPALGVATATSVNIGSSTLINGVIDDDTMATASATTVPTSESTKAYVDAAGGGGIGSFVFIEKKVASASATIEFNNLDPTYAAYKVVISSMTPSITDQYLYLRTSTDNGVSFDSGASDYSFVLEAFQVAGSGLGASYVGDKIQITTNTGATGVLTNASFAYSGEVSLIDLGSTTSNKQVSFTGMHGYTGPTGINEYGNGLRYTNTAIDAIQFAMLTGNITSGEFSLYGLPTTGGGSATVTPWVAYTPTFTGFGTVASIEVWSRRVGDSLEIRARFTAGTVTAVEARMTLGYNGTNSNVTSSNTKITGVQMAGLFMTGSGVSSAYYNSLIEANTGYVTFGTSGGGSGGVVPTTATNISGSSNVNTFMAQVPVDTWP